ncbi:Signal recognition particle receptor FtsY [Streptomyces microflavus]
MVVGVNGTGKTTTTGKLARVLVADGRSVVLGAADTFRAAAADQLQPGRRPAAGAATASAARRSGTGHDRGRAGVPEASPRAAASVVLGRAARDRCPWTDWARSSGSWRCSAGSSRARARPGRPGVGGGGQHGPAGSPARPGPARVLDVLFREWDAPGAAAGGAARPPSASFRGPDLLQEPQPVADRQASVRSPPCGGAGGLMSHAWGSSRPPEVLRARPARSQGGRGQAARLLRAVQHEPPDDPPRAARGRPGADPPRAVRQPGLREPRTQAMLYAMEARAYANMGQPGKCKRAVRMAEDTFVDAGLDGSRTPTGSASSPRPSSRGERPLLP